MPVVLTHTSLVSQLLVTQLSLWHPHLLRQGNVINQAHHADFFERIP